MYSYSLPRKLHECALSCLPRHYVLLLASCSIHNPQMREHHTSSSLQRHRDRYIASKSRKTSAPSQMAQPSSNPHMAETSPSPETRTCLSCETLILEFRLDVSSRNVCWAVVWDGLTRRTRGLFIESSWATFLLCVVPSPFGLVRLRTSYT